MLTCETCGKVLPEGTSFCPNCGMPVEHTDSAAQPDAPNAPAPDTAAPESNPYAMPSGGSAPHPAAFRNRVIPELIRPAAIPAMAHSRTSPRASRSPIPNSPTMDSSPSRITGSRETAAIFRRSSRAIRAVTRIIPRTIRTTAPTARQLPDWCWAFSPS